ncbi:hypothetical protein SRIMM317S_01670 [Streptomyces rimosus subsp. rimosus]
MSSVTTSTTEWLHVQPFSSTRAVGVCTRTFSRAPWGTIGQPVVGERGAEDVHRITAGEVLRRGVQVVALEVSQEGVRVEALYRCLSPGRAALSDPGGPREQLGLGFVQLGLHVLFLAPVARRCVTSWMRSVEAAQHWSQP